MTSRVVASCARRHRVTYWCRGLGQPLVNGLSPSTDQRSGTAFSAVAGAITVHVSAKPKDTSDGRKITAVASQRRCDIA